MKKSLYTVWIFTKLNTRRFFRDRVSLFFGVAFPVIFLFIFGGIFGKGGDASFNIALINQSQTSYAQELANHLKSSKTYKIDQQATTLELAQEKMSRNQIDGTVVIPADFGQIKDGRPSGQVEIQFTHSNESAGQTLGAVLQGDLQALNASFVTNKPPFTVVSNELSRQSLTRFDYTFAGLLGFSIIGIGIFGPMNVFPELKKQGILRRLRTTPLKVWQYFVSTALSQVATGLVAMAALFLVAITVFHLHVTGNYVEIALFLVFGIVMILGIGLALGGWAKNERQVAPLGNLITFPMIFLSGTFFPRFLMPHWLQTVSSYIPLTPVIDGVRLLTTESKHLVDLGPQLGLMAVWLVIIYAIAFKVFRWE